MPGSRAQKQVMRTSKGPSGCCVDDKLGSASSGGSNQTKQPAYKAPKQVGKKFPSASGFLK